MAVWRSDRSERLLRAARGAGAGPRRPTPPPVHMLRPRRLRGRGGALRTASSARSRCRCGEMPTGAPSALSGLAQVPRHSPGITVRWGTAGGAPLGFRDAQAASAARRRPQGSRVSGEGRRPGRGIVAAEQGTAGGGGAGRSPGHAWGQEWSRGDLGEIASFPPGMLWIWKNNDLGWKVKLG